MHECSLCLLLKDAKVVVIFPPLLYNTGIYVYVQISGTTLYVYLLVIYNVCKSHFWHEIKHFIIRVIHWETCLTYKVGIWMCEENVHTAWEREKDFCRLCVNIGLTMQDYWQPISHLDHLVAVRMSAYTDTKSMILWLNVVSLFLASIKKHANRLDGKPRPPRRLSSCSHSSTIS